MQNDDPPNTRKQSHIHMKQPFLATIGTLAIVLSHTAWMQAAEEATVRPAGAPARPANHARPFEPAVPTAFLPLPPGAVEPAGWLRDWAQAAREGITGHLDEWHPTFADGWKGIPSVTTDYPFGETKNSK